MLACTLAVSVAPQRVESAAGPAATSAACATPRIGFMAPLTGSAAFIGKEQLGFARYAIKSLSPGEIRLVEGDTQLDPARAGSAARKLHTDARVLAVVGPAGSQEVLRVAPIFERAPRLPFISASAIAASLTNGSIPNFFRVVPSERAQPATIARHVLRVLNAAEVVIVDDRSSYSKPLAGRVAARLRAAGTAVTRLSVSAKVTDFSSLLSRIEDDVDVVFLPWQIAANAQLFGQQLRSRGQPPTIVGSDALDSRDFRIAGSYVTAFAPDIRGIEGNDAFIRGYGAKFVSNFGPPAYVATQVAVAAIRKACADGTATRREVQANVTATELRRIVLGGGLRFTPRGDRKGAAFSVFKVGAGGKKTLVG